MSKLLLLCIAVGSLGMAVQRPQRKVPTPEAIAQVAERRKSLELIDPVNDPDKAAQALARLVAALNSADDHVFDEAGRNILNSEYRRFPDETILKVLLPVAAKTLRDWRAAKPIEENYHRTIMQAHLLGSVSRYDGNGAKGKDLLPDLLKIVRDDKVGTYQRRCAIEAAARIEPGDAEVVRAFIDALKNPNPTSESGVHDTLVACLGHMGKAAWPAKKAIEAIMDRGEFYEDGVFHSLGLLAMDETPRPLADYLDRLRQFDKTPTDELAAAYVHVRTICNPDRIDPRYFDPKQKERAAQVRAVLYEIVSKRMKDDVTTRGALGVFRSMGPAPGPRRRKSSCER